MTTTLDKTKNVYHQVSYAVCNQCTHPFDYRTFRPAHTI